MGCLVILALYYFMLQKSFEIARKARDRERALLALGITGIFAVQIIVNLGMTMGLLPVGWFTCLLSATADRLWCSVTRQSAMLLNIS